MAAADRVIIGVRVYVTDFVMPDPPAIETAGLEFCSHQKNFLA